MKKLTKSRRRKLEKKKRKKKQERREAKTPSLAYTGNKFRTAKYARFTMETETAIHEADVITDRTLTDADVEDALTEMIARLRAGKPLPTPEELEELSADKRRVFDQWDFLLHNIAFHWNCYFEDNPPLGRDARVGVLRTILGSIEVRGSMARSARGYLDFIEEFLGQMGVSTRLLTAEEVERLGIR